jgi:SAM-dependent methyltransferase
MSVSTAQHAVAELIDAFTGAPPERLGDDFRRLVDAVWHDGAATDQAPVAAPVLAAVLAGRRTEPRDEPLGEPLDEAHLGHLAVLLGLLAETEYPTTDGPIITAIRAHLGAYLDLWRRSPAGEPLSLAIQYLVAHLPADREPILAVADGLGLDEDDLSRLDRALQSLDPERPVLGRVFPSPSVWELDDSEREFDQGWIRALTPAQVEENWRKDTRMVLGHVGAKAYWAVRNGAPRPWVSDSIPPRDSRPADAAGDGFARHAGAFRCPDCGGRLEFRQSSAGCAGCGLTYPISSGILNLTVGVRGDAARDEAGLVADFQFKLAEMPSMGFFYEAYARPNFLRISGANWGGAVSPADEDAYIAEHVRPVAGPVLDLAAGAGRWTEVLADAVGADRVIALDLNPPMLSVLRARLPEIPAVLASARTLPFDDASLGAVLCWNALQAFPDDAAAAIAEVGRCLRPGGTFTLLTFRRSDDPIYRHFVMSHHFPQNSDGLRLLDYGELKGWLADAGLTVRHEWGPGTFVFITAERPRDSL